MTECKTLLDVFPVDAFPWEEKALKELNDAPETRAEKLEQFKALIRQYEQKERNFKSLMDDDFLMAFLRTRKFDIQKAFSCLQRFYELRQCKPDIILPKGKGPRDYPHVLDLPIGTLLRERNTKDGCFIAIWSFRNYDSKVGEMPDVFNVTFYAGIELLANPSIQTFGTRFIFDCTGMSLMHSAMLLTRMYYIKALIATQNAIPARFVGFHIVNDPYGIAKTAYNMIKMTIPEKIRQRVHFHGSDLSQLHSYVSPKILPDELGGEAGPMTADWLKTILYNLHDEIVRKSYFGYT